MSRTSSGRIVAAPGSADSRLNGLAPLPTPAGTGPFLMKGNGYRGFVSLVEKVFPGGTEAFAEALEDESLKAFVRQPFLATARYDIFPFVPLYATLARRLGTPLEALVRSSTMAQVRFDAQGVYKRIFDTESIPEISARFARFNTQIYDFGRFESEMLAPDRVRMIYAGIPAYIRPWYGPMHTAYAEASIALKGGKEVRITAGAVEPAGTRSGYPLLTFRTELSWK